MFYDTDAGGVVHNLAYLRMIEHSRTQLAAKLGMSMAQMAAKNEYAVLVRTEVDYLRPARIGDRLLVTSTLAGVDRVRFYVESQVTRESDKRIMVKCRQTLANVRFPEGKVLPAPAKWAALLPPCPGGSPA